MKDFLLDVSEADRKYAVGENLTVTVIGEGAEVFHRRAVRVTNGVAAEPETMLVARVAGVSIYIRDDQLIMTTADLYL